eukprot:5972743-Heterocapsa_arctica.AAC.1
MRPPALRPRFAVSSALGLPRCEHRLHAKSSRRRAPRPHYRCRELPTSRSRPPTRCWRSTRPTQMSFS